MGDDLKDEAVGAFPNGLSDKDFDYDVGYGKPSRHSQFKKGTSGNLGGKPIGTKNKPKVLKHPALTELLREGVWRGVEGMDGKQRVTIPRIESVIRNLAVKADAGRSSCSDVAHFSGQGNRDGRHERTAKGICLCTKLQGQTPEHLSW